ncbi:hypothetical protein [Sulfurimonas sp. HSL-1716]|uniref:hypothetical protein n=1 Tax=Hydrocurvibacter sulfurireducens TaxID=3131937 RepID=UPI0031F900DA
MINLATIEEFVMRYLFKDGSECYDCIQVENSLVLSQDKQTIRATLKSKISNINLNPFDIVLTIKDNKLWIKSDFFEDASALYPLRIYSNDDEYILVAEFSTEVMYLHVECS